MRSKVVHIITTLDVGGAQETLVETVTGLDRHEFDPVVIAGAGKVNGSLAERLAEAQVSVIRVPGLRRSIGTTELAAFDQLRRLISRLDAEIVHTHSSKAGVLGRLASSAVKPRPKIVHTVHGWSFHDRQPAPFKRAAIATERKLAARTDALIVVTEVDRLIGLSAGIGANPKYNLIRSGIRFAPERDLSLARHRARGTLGLEPDLPVVGWVGRFSRQKDPSTLIATIVLLARRWPSLTCVLVGTGPDELFVRSQLAAAGIGRRVRLLGFRDDVAALLPAFDVALLTSAWEGLPRTVVEALACGLPVVTTNVGGVREVVRDGDNGYITEIGDAEAIANGVSSCLLGHVRGPQRPEQLRIREQFSAEAMVRATEDLYRGLLHG